MFNIEQPYADPYGGSRATGHPNPLFDYLTTFTPRRLKDLIRTAEFIGVNSAHIYGVVRKFGEYPITRLSYETSSAKERERHELLFDKHLRMKGQLTLISFDVHVTGNSFVSLYEPITRLLRCSRCKTDENITVASYAFNLDKTEFRIDCKSCKATKVVAQVIDTPLRDPSKMRLIRWDPKLIDIAHNPITGETEYYYTIPRDVVSKVRAGDRLMINHMPLGFLQAMRDRRLFKFAPDAIYHLRMPGLAGLDSPWGLPPITSAIKLFMFAATLRRANEAIAMEHIVPFRVLHPAQATGMGDPLTTLNLGRWRSELELNMRAHRRDPLRAMFSPVPVGVQNVGGDGRAMLTLGELQEAEKTIVMSLGVPIEFLTGGLGQTRGEITLRMIENQLRTHIENLNGVIQWVERRACEFLKWTSVPTKLTDFKMIDDIDAKQLKLQLFSQKQLSRSTVSDTIDVDIEHERRMIKQEALDDARAEAETQIALQKQQQAISLSARRSAVQARGGIAYDPQQVLAANAPIAEELSQYDEGTKRSRLDALQGEDPVAYAVVRMLLEQQQQNAAASARQQGGPM